MNIDVEKLKRIIDDAVQSGEESGLQLCIYLNGKEVMNYWAGVADEEGHPVTEKTLFPVFSCGKGIMSIGAHILYERGLLDYNAKISKYWQEYGCNGKEDTLVWHALTHRAGMQKLPELDDFSDQGNWELMCRKIAEGKPAWAPGGKHCYHGVTFAWTVGETCGRAAGMPFQQFLRENVMAPLGIEEELVFGTNAEQDARRARVTNYQEGDPCWCRDFAECDRIRHGFVPSANGHATARGLARAYAGVMAEVDGVRLLKKETVDNATIVRRSYDDPLTDTWDQFGLGWAVPGLPPGSIFGHGGALGAEGFADKATGLAVGFTKNHVTLTHPVHPVRDRIAEALGISIRHW